MILVRAGQRRDQPAGDGVGEAMHVVDLRGQYEKPWEASHPKAEQLKPLIELWQAYFTGEGVPDVTALKNPGSGSRTP